VSRELKCAFGLQHKQKYLDANVPQDNLIFALTGPEIVIAGGREVDKT
jgi:hypothetical protein